MTLQEQIAVMQAFEDGKKIQMKLRLVELWTDTTDDPQWNWPTMDYRIKPEPEFTYPMWFQNTNQHFIVRFDSLGSGEVTQSTIALYKIGDYSQAWVHHTDKNIWIQVPEPKQTTLLECLVGPSDVGRYKVEFVTQEQYDTARPGVYIQVLRTIQLEDQQWTI